MVGADRREAEGPQPRRGIGRPDTAERLRVLVERQQRHDRQGRDRANRVDRGEQLVEVVEGLEHEEVDAAALEQLGLLGEQRTPVLFVVAEVAEGADRAADIDVAAGDLARLARELHRGAVDRGDVVLEEVPSELAAIGAEGVRLDQVRARSDEPEVQRDHALGRAEVRFLGAAEPGHRRGDEHAHAAVADERRSFAESFDEAGGHGPRA